ncbi:hypothetical protein ASNO1_73880 [Corallococcus caeni]|uniref:Uncharacterized protein n=1 Tax=Corallococcus caeni TaxID=3082388 RepID=A0ABQ6R484_9BACT|nr:hypothetical protein ASNO1_73880 [Corallococcus sp. NO1]
MDALEGLALVLEEGGAQGFVARDERLEGAAQGLDIQAPQQAQGDRKVVGRVVRRQLVEEPEALLGEGKWLGAFSARASEGRQARARRRTLQLLREGRDGGGLEEGAEGKLHVERGAHAGHQLGGEQRMATQLEEVVRATHGGDAQHFAPERRELLLQRRHRRFVGVRGPQQARVRDGEGLAVHLAVGGQRQCLHGDKGRGHHVLRQVLLEVGAEGGDVEGLTHDVGHQPLVPRSILAGEHDGVLHSGGSTQGVLDLAQLDAEAAHLHLGVNASHEVQLAVRAPAHHVARTVEASPFLTGKGIRHEALGGQARTSCIPTRDAHATDVQFTAHAHRHRLPLRVEHVDAHVRQRLADGGHVPIRDHLAERGDDGGFRGAVRIEQPPPRGPARDDVGGQGLTAGDDGAHLGQPFGGRGRQCRRGEADDTQFLLTQQHGQRGARHQLLQRREHQRGAVAERGEDFFHGQVEAEARELQHATARPDAVGHCLMRDEVGDAAVLHRRAFRRARAA